MYSEKFEKKLNTSENELNVSEQRIILLQKVIEEIKEKITPEELDNIKAILVFGSTASGYAKDGSDVDIWISSNPEKKDVTETIRKIINKLEDSIPELNFEFGGQPIVPNSRAARFIVKRSAKHPERIPEWKFLYTTNDQTKTDLENVLQETLDGMQSNKNKSKV